MVYKDVKDYLRGYYQQIQTHTKEIEERYNILEIKNYIKSVNNAAAESGEITDNYIIHFLSGRSAMTKVMLGQRLKDVYRDLLFVRSMSSFEYAFIKILLLYPSLSCYDYITSVGVRRVMISQLFKLLIKDDLIDNKHLWEYSISLRNDIVHFDAFGRETMNCPEIEFPITMKEGEMAKGFLRSFICLTKALENSYFEFITRLPLE